MLEFRGIGGKSTWFRAVTYSDDPAKRELIGYAKTLEDAAQAVWDYAMAKRREAGEPQHASPPHVERD